MTTIHASAEAKNSIGALQSDGRFERLRVEHREEQLERKQLSNKRRERSRTNFKAKIVEHKMIRASGEKLELQIY